MRVSGGGAASQRPREHKKPQEMIMKSLIATALVAFGLLSAVAATAQAANDLPGYPEWAQRAFDNKG
jgi:hypothetical protein